MGALRPLVDPCNNAAGGEIDQALGAARQAPADCDGGPAMTALATGATLIAARAGNRPVVVAPDRNSRYLRVAWADHKGRWTLAPVNLHRVCGRGRASVLRRHLIASLETAGLAVKEIGSASAFNAYVKTEA
jgi:hypothetical protein